jgi:3-isopropylmalate/(R)-2-methylmalate dehydratase small subunit
MDRFESFTGLAAVLDVPSVDTDQIIPKQFLKRVERSGYGEYLFFEWRFNPDGSANQDFILNQPRFAGASILLAGPNFGSGSSREHAVWALAGYGFKVLLSSSFADIFKGNCLMKGMLALELPQETMGQWLQRAKEQEGYLIAVDLQQQALTGSDGFSCTFQIDPFVKRRFLEGLDDIGLTLTSQAAIEKYEKEHHEPWQAAVTASCLE